MTPHLERSGVTPEQRQRRADAAWEAIGSALVTGDDLAAAALNAADEEVPVVADTWLGLMTILDRHYPTDVFDGSSGDPGPRLIALLRVLDTYRVLADAVERHCDPADPERPDIVDLALLLARCRKVDPQ